MRKLILVGALLGLAGCVSTRPEPERILLCYRCPICASDYRTYYQCVGCINAHYDKPGK